MNLNNENSKRVLIIDRLRSAINWETCRELKAPVISHGKFIKTLLKSEDDSVNKSIIIEECSELIKAITKDIRHKDGARAGVIEEMVDVLIGLQMCMDIYKISQDELDEEYNKKMLRNLSRINKNSEDNVKYIKFKDLDPREEYSGVVVIDFERCKYSNEEMDSKLEKLVKYSMCGFINFLIKGIDCDNYEYLKKMINRLNKDRKYIKSCIQVVRVSENG